MKKAAHSGEDRSPLSPRAQQKRAMEEQLLLTAFADIRPVPMGFSVGIVAGTALFLATAVLVVRGSLLPGEPVGPMLNLLNNFFPGYRVSWTGALLGWFYGFLNGFLAGATTAALVNLSHRIYLSLHRRRSRSTRSR